MAAVFLDPGHGGTEPGAVTADGKREADGNLRLALILAPMLLAAGHSVRLSREEDVMLSLSERVKRAWEWGTDLLISLHIDGAGSPAPSGHHVIHSITDKRGERGDRLAWLLVRGIADATGRPPFARSGGPVWTRRSLVLPWLDYHSVIRHAIQRGIEAPVIVERGFVSNPDDARLLFDDEYLIMQAGGIVMAVDQYEIP
ncbi:MAG: N-acetylmuramoyl-L-alanine amidase [Bacillota bacterium]|nr:N-acetylmuramoyl-L-alanine amidase [Bacillota bacterium]